MQYSSILLLFWLIFSISGGLEENTYYPISDWSKCDKQCKTYRKLICTKFAQCGINIIREDANCCSESNNIYYLANSAKNKARKRYIMPSKAKCKRSQNTPMSLKILGGTLSKRNKWPWHVALLNDFREVYCAGTLITPRWVLTAAHCQRKTMIIRINEYDLENHDKGQEDVYISQDRIHIHPRFNQYTVDNDIALLKLQKPFRLPVACLPTKKPTPNRLCSIMGWGKVNMKNEYGTRFLHEAKISVMTQRKCRYAYREFLLTRNMFCAGVRSGKVDTCGGDSGGGLMCPKNVFANRRDKGRVYYSIDGITSFGDGCGLKEKYGIYTLVFNFVPWIKKTIYKNT